MKMDDYCRRLSELTSPDDKRVRKRIFQAIGKLKRKMSIALDDQELTSDRKLSDEPPAKRLKSESSVLKISKKHMKAKLKLLNDELNSYARKKMPHAAQKCLEVAIKKGINPDVHAYTNIINAFVRCDDMNGAQNTLEKMTSAGVKPNVVTYTSLAKGFCERHDIESALKYLCDESLTGINIRSVNTLLRGCLRSGDIETAYKVYHDIGVVWTVQKDINSVEYIVYQLCQSLRLSDAETVVSNYQLGNCDCNVAITLCLCRASAILCEWDSMEGYLARAIRLCDEAKTAPLLQSMMDRSCGLKDKKSRSKLLFLRHRNEELRRDATLLQKYLLSQKQTPKSDGDILLQNINILLRLLHFKKGRERTVIICLSSKFSFSYRPVRLY